VEFYAMKAKRGPDAKPEEDLRVQAVAAVVRALALPAYHLTAANQLIERLQPSTVPTRKR
jgi:hypothetical protein